MKCPNCGGTGAIQIAPNVKGLIRCPVCGGSGEVSQIEKSNEQWFDTLSTKEKAEWLDKVAENCCQICDEENRELCRGNLAIGCKFENAEKWEMWLKQPHRKE